MALISEERREAYFNQSVDDHVGAAAGLNRSAVSGTPLPPISEMAEFVPDDELPPQEESRPADNLAAPSRRPSMFAGARRLSQAAPLASWNFLRLSTAAAISWLTPRLAAHSSTMLQGMSWRARMDFYLSQPEDSTIGWFIQSAMMVALVANIAIMAAETLDGPRYDGSDPGYAYLPGKAVFLVADGAFTAIYVLEFALRSFVARHPSQYWKSWTTWLNLAALLPFFIHVGLDAINGGNLHYNGVKTEDRVAFVRISRVVRLVTLAQMFLGTKILIRVSKKVLAPLKITLFFLITVVMVFATAIFYAEPCYDLSTCTFTDIFNAGYFVMVTVATVGYGSQVPSFSFPGSIFIACIVMLFGTLYLAMPLAIVGIKYDLAWREYDEKKNELNRASRALLPALEGAGGVDDTLKGLATSQATSSSLQLGEQFLEIGQNLIEVDVSLCSLMESADSTTLDAATHLSQLRSDHTNKALDAIMTVLKLHKRVCKVVRESLVVDEEATKKRASSSKLSERMLSLAKRAGSGKGSSRSGTKSGLSKAKSALTAITARVTIKQRVRHQQQQGFRARVWDIFEHNDRSWRAAAVNRFRLLVVILSIVLFYSQTTPELQLTGLRTVLCRRTIKDFCATDGQPGCFVQSADGTATTKSVDFTCAIDSKDATCYGAGYNYGSDSFADTCQHAFGLRGAKRVCNNRLCKPSESFMLDMEPYWVYFEFVFGILFTIEMLVRASAHPVPSMLLSDLTLLTDLAVLFPFYVETTSIILGVMPIYSVVPTAPSFLTGVRILKTLRILKVGTHIPGARVLLKTGELIYRRLMIPLFLLFVGCVIGAAIFYELERGTECFVGRKCMWWDINVLTPSISAGLPPGKRILVQNTDVSLFTDMLRSTWFSLVTFTTVGYGDMYPRTALGKLFDIFCMIGSACYTAMPLTLVGGQFYVCYEVFLQEEKRRRHGIDHQIAPKQEKAQAAAASGATQDSDRGVSFTSNAQSLVQAAALPLEVAPISLPGLSDMPSVPGLNTEGSGAKPAGAAGAKPGGVQEPEVSTFEMHILKQFFLVHKVLNEIIEDMSSLNRLGSERVAALKRSATGADSASSTLESVDTRERALEAKISDNMVFCVTVYLAFAPLIERSQGLHVTRTGRNSIKTESVRMLPSSAANTPVSTPDAPPVLPLTPLDIQLHDPQALNVLDATLATDRTGHVTSIVVPQLSPPEESAAAAAAAASDSAAPSTSQAGVRGAAATENAR